MAAILVNDGVGKQRGQQQQNDRGATDVAADVHLSESLLIELNDRPEQQNGEQALGVVVVIKILGRAKSESINGIILADCYQSRAKHINCEGQIAEDVFLRSEE